MRKVRTYFFAACALLAAVSCRNEEMESQFRDFDLAVSAKVSSLVGGTKIDLYNSEEDIRTKTLHIHGWEDGVEYIPGADAEYDGTTWNLSASYKVKSRGTYNFWASTGSLAEFYQDSVALVVNDIASVESQEDILLGKASLNKPLTGDVPICFSHPYASVKFMLSAVDGVKSVNEITLSGVYKSGRTSLSESNTEDAGGITVYNWTQLGDANATVSASGLNVTQDSIATFAVIPQELSGKNVVMTIKYTSLDDEENTMTKVIAGGRWRSGYTTTYTLGHVDAVDIVFADNIVNNGRSAVFVRATITGAWYIGDDAVASWMPSATELANLGDGWEAQDGIYYYPSSVPNGESPDPLFTACTPSASPVDGAVLRIKVLVQAIPYDSSRTCREAFEAL